MAGEITHADLLALADRLESSTRREVDRVHGDLRTHIEDSKAAAARLDARYDDMRADVTQHGQDIRVLQHDVRLLSHLGPVRGRAGKPPKAFVAGVVAAVMGLAGAAEALHELVKRVWR